MQEFLITILVVFILFRVFRRMIFKTAFSAFAKHQQDQQKRKEEEEWKRKKEGSITIEKLKQDKSASNDKGEYIDFEEIK